MGEPVTLIVRVPVPVQVGTVSAPVPVHVQSLFIPGPPGPAGRDAGTPTMLAGASIAAYQHLMFDASGNVVPGDPNAPGYVFAGIAQAAALTGAAVPIADLGLMTNPAWSWTPGQALYAAPGGALTASVPTTRPVFQVAKAVTATTIFIEPYESVAGSVIDGGNF